MNTRKFFIVAAVAFAIAALFCGWTAVLHYSFPSLFETLWAAAWETAYGALWLIGALAAYAVLMYLNYVVESAPLWLKEYRRKRYDFKYAEMRARRAATCSKCLPFFVLSIAALMFVPATAWAQTSGNFNAAPSTISECMDTCADSYQSCKAKCDNIFAQRAEKVQRAKAECRISCLGHPDFPEAEDCCKSCDAGNYRLCQSKGWHVATMLWDAMCPKPTTVAKPTPRLSEDDGMRSIRLLIISMLIFFMKVTWPFWLAIGVIIKAMTAD